MLDSAVEARVGAGVGAGAGAAIGPGASARVGAGAGKGVGAGVYRRIDADVRAGSSAALLEPVALPSVARMAPAILRALGWNRRGRVLSR